MLRISCSRIFSRLKMNLKKGKAHLNGSSDVNDVIFAYLYVAEIDLKAVDVITKM